MSRVWTPSHDSAGAPHPAARLRVYTRGTLPLRQEDLSYFKERFEIDPHEIRARIARGSEGRYLLFILDPKGSSRGVVARTPWANAPFWTAFPPEGPKAITYRSSWGPVQSHYGVHMGPLVVVEDQISAIKLASHGYGSVALLGTPADVVGTYGGSDRVAELASRARTHDEVIVALDSDATDAAFMFVRKWGSAFRRIRVAILSRDIKDTPSGELEEVLGA